MWFQRSVPPAAGGSIQFYEDERPFAYAGAQRPLIPGAPGFPVHPTKRRIVYGLTAVLTSFTGAWGNAIVTTNLPYLQGGLGLDLSEIAWLPVVFLVVNAVTGCVLVKFRQQFGIRRFCLVFLFLQVMLIAFHLQVQGLASAIVVRAFSGISASALTTMSIFLMIQAFPAAHRMKALLVGIALPQLAIPTAWLFPKDFLFIGNWQGLYLFELGLSLLTLSIIMLVRLPPSIREKAFEPLDALTMCFYAGGFALFGSAVGLGSALWWTNETWIGVCLAASFPVFGVAILIESRRKKPLINVHWLSSLTLVRWAVIAMACRIVFTEQTVGVAGMLRDFGLTNDDVRLLSALIAIAFVMGLVAGALVVTSARLPYMVMFGLTLISLAAFKDSFSSVDTRVPQLLLSQTMIAFAMAFCLGPSFISGLSHVLAEGGHRMTSFIALFGITQSLGTLIGSAFVQSYLFYAQQYHLSDFAAQVEKTDPLAGAAVSSYSSRLSAVLADPALRISEGVVSLSQDALLEARVAGYNDVFFAIAAIAAAAASILLLATVVTGIKNRLQGTI